MQTRNPCVAVTGTSAPASPPASPEKTPPRTRSASPGTAAHADGATMRSRGPTGARTASSVDHAGEQRYEHDLGQLALLDRPVGVLAQLQERLRGTAADRRHQRAARRE